MDPITALTAFAPLVVDFGKSLIAKYVAPDQFKPATIEQYTAMKQTDIQMFQAMNNAGGTNASYPWVEAVVRLMRPAVGMVVLGTWSYMKLTNQQSPEVDNFACAIGFYLFGDRTLFYSRQGK